MAGTTRTQSGVSQPAFDETRQEHNKLVDDVEVLRQAVEDGVDQVAALIADNASLRTQLTAAIADRAIDRTAINAIITAAATNIGAVAAVTPAAAPTAVNPAAATAAAVTKTGFDTAGDLTAAKVKL